jgi:plastocyanin
VAGAARYEVRVYEGSSLLIRKSGISKTSWKSAAALPANVGLAWKVRAGGRAGTGPWSKKEAFTIVTPSSAKAVTSFAFVTPAASGVINEASHTIAVTVPAGTDVSALAPTLAITGVSVAPASGVPHDFTSPATYTVTAADGSTQAYTVTVSVQPSQNAQVQILSFAFTPKTLTVARGTTVVWTNNDAVHHTVTSVDGLDVNATPTGLFDSGSLGIGQTFSFTFTNPGTFFYECRIHSGDASMHAQVIVQ